MLLPHSHWDILHHLQHNFFSNTTSHQKNKRDNYVIIIMFSATMLMEVEYPMSTQIQDLQLANKMVWMKITIFQAVKPCSWLMLWRTYCLHFQGHKQWRLLVGSSLQTKMGMFITKHSSFSIYASNLLSTNSTISKHAFKLSR